MRQGQLVQLEAHGADIESKRSMKTDDIFAVSSMTKPVAAVAVLMLAKNNGSCLAIRWRTQSFATRRWQ